MFCTLFALCTNRAHGPMLAWCSSFLGSLVRLCSDDTLTVTIPAFSYAALRCWPYARSGPSQKRLSSSKLYSTASRTRRCSSSVFASLTMVSMALSPCSVSAFSWTHQNAVCSWGRPYFSSSRANSCPAPGTCASLAILTAASPSIKGRCATVHTRYVRSATDWYCQVEEAYGKVAHYEHANPRLSWLPISARDYLLCGVALSPLLPELPRCRRTWDYAGVKKRNKMLVL
jgi:hypothetical protein